MPISHSIVRATPRRFALVIAAAFVVPLASRAPLAAQSAHASHAATARAVDASSASVALLTNLGSWHRRIATAVPLAQRYFDQGLRLYYAFNHAEAVRAFREAQRLDPRCVMCAWGEAMALGPNINAPMDSASERRAAAATERASSLVRGAPANSADARWVRAISARYIGPASSRAARDSAYASAMSTIADGSPQDVDALALAAEATMTLSPWNYWSTDGMARPGTVRAVARLERGMRLAPDHPGACHFYIHAVEAVEPRKAVRCAERLASLMPGAGHIVHMPAHIYIRTGRWADAIATNKHAVHADETYFDGPHTSDDAMYATAYRSHNHHFLAFAAVMAGASATAIEASRRVTEIVTPEMARLMPPVEPMLAIPVQTLVTFGRWDDVLRAPLPPRDLRIAMAHAWFARGVAFSATGRAAEARATVDSIRAAVRSIAPGESRTTLEIAALVVEGEMALRAGDAATAARHFAAGVELEDALTYLEPPTWHYPVRHSLGKALLAAGQPREAELVYRADLARFPENGWSLRGLSLALVQQGRTMDAEQVQKRFAAAWRMSDVTLPASRF